MAHVHETWSGAITALSIGMAIATSPIHAENPASLVTPPSRSSTTIAGYDSDGNELRRDSKGVIWSTDGEVWWLPDGPDQKKPKIANSKLPVLMMPQGEISPGLRSSDYQRLLGERAKTGPLRPHTEEFHHLGLPGTGISYTSESVTLHVLCGPSRSQFVSCR